MEVDALFTKCRQRDGSTGEGNSSDTNDATTTEVAAMNASGDDPQGRREQWAVLENSVCLEEEERSRAQPRPFGQLLPQFYNQTRSFGLFSLYMTVAAEGFAGMTGLNASVRRLTKVVQSTTTSVL
ncbi:hypothetical protein LR48_Vigan05g104500 [Vigna angularis]|uniref:Uncharacterized protein n=1 Tax=Phaseolus angularis TaxID=3914 RepID=A0A0L9UL92_PHAAN|nr:hypothetical protein LR48_Vigan05g104500 [Vigna angularis]